MDEERRQKKKYDSQVRAILKYRSEKCVRKELVFYPSELDILDKAEDRALEQEKSFTKYVKDLIRDDVD